MKYLLLVLTFLSTGALAIDPLTREQLVEVEAHIAEAASKGMYITYLCDKPIDPSKFKEFAKIKAFSEGYFTLEGVQWSAVEGEAKKQYQVLKADAPNGELCEKIMSELQIDYKFLKDIN